MNVVAAMPAPANAKPMSTPPGGEDPHGDATRPSSTIVTRNAAA